MQSLLGPTSFRVGLKTDTGKTELSNPSQNNNNKKVFFRLWHYSICPFPPVKRTSMRALNLLHLLLLLAAILAPLCCVKPDILNLRSKHTRHRCSRRCMSLHSRVPIN